MQKRVLALLLAVVMMVACFAACGNNNNTTSSKAPASSTAANDGSSTAEPASSTVAANSGEKIDPTACEDKIDVSIAIMTGFTQPESRVEKMLEEKYNVNIDLRVLPGWADGQSTINLWMAADDTPNIMWWWSMDNDFIKWRDAGKLVDVSEYLNKYTNIRDYYNKMDPKTLFYATEEGGAVYRIPGDVSEPSCEVLWIRQDWLDKLNLKAPTNFDELEEVMRAFTEDDPDGNGAADTYGLGGDGYDFRSFWPWIQGYDYTHYDRWVVDDNGKVGYGPAQENTKEWVAKVADLYKKGYITPNITQDTDRDSEMANGGFGITYSWCAWMNPTSGTMMSFYQSNPDAKWVPIDMVAGPNGNPQEDPATSAAWAYFALTNTCGENAERIFAMYDDMCGLENYIERRYGVEGEDYNMVDGIYEGVITPEGTENNDQNIGLNLFNNLFNRKDEGLIDNTPETRALFEKSGAASRDMAAHLVEWRNPADLTEWVSCSTDIEDEKNRYLWGVIAGTESVDTWDTYVATLNGLGLEDATAQAQEVYDAQNALMENYMNNKVNQQ